MSTWSRRPRFSVSWYLESGVKGSWSRFPFLTEMSTSEGRQQVPVTAVVFSQMVDGSEQHLVPAFCGFCLLLNINCEVQTIDSETILLKKREILCPGLLFEVFIFFMLC